MSAVKSTVLCTVAVQCKVTFVPVLIAQLKILQLKTSGTYIWLVGCSLADIRDDQVSRNFSRLFQDFVKAL